MFRKSGEKCLIEGHYEFAGYLDGTHTPEPVDTERTIYVARGEVFPSIVSCGRECWWRLL